MPKKRGAETLFFVLFLDYWQGLLWLAPFPPVSDGKAKSLRTLLPKSTRHSKGGLEPKSSSPSPGAGSNTEFSSSSKTLDEGLAKIFDEILQQVFSKVPLDKMRTAGKSITKREVKESKGLLWLAPFPPVSDGKAKSLRTLLPKSTRHSKGGLEPKSSSPSPGAGYPPVKSLKNTELISSSNNREQHLAKLFGFIKAASVAGYSTEPRFLLGSMDRISINGRRDKEPSLVNGNINERLTTGDEEGFQEAVRTDTQDKNVPCTQLLHFLQRNIILAAASVAGILVVTTLLLLALTTCIRRKRPLHPPANTTYNVFIMSGKSWWQKYQEKNLRKHSDKQKQLLKSKSHI
ncbi:uncharacterized protein C2orf92 homolog isoform X2 [Canis lupus baileyi]|uniref:uncharacterized protein C2orf92 homolog isoform X2 n=1 Tax=Canis lupus dingo TaxID=286419 RepID=UPI000BAA1867|nr:uncharacterized protein C2orf92 homolog isoform X2 [Canis lupus dingo]|eukprot:XP_022280344.1 uncharacterized protein LOC102155757 isoform X2 [Canis lupus familiaris]